MGNPVPNLTTEFSSIRWKKTCMNLEFKDVTKSTKMWIWEPVMLISRWLRKFRKLLMISGYQKTGHSKTSLGKKNMAVLAPTNGFRWKSVFFAMPTKMVCFREPLFSGDSGTDCKENIPVGKRKPVFECHCL